MADRSKDASKVMYSGHCIFLAFSMMAVMVAMCFMTPFRKPFCVVVSMNR